jgi:hypothetical protein
MGIVMKPSGYGIASSFLSCGGYGLLLMTGLAHGSGIAPSNQHFAAASLSLGFGLVTSGLIIATMGKLRRLMVPEAAGLIGCALAALALGYSLDPASGAGRGGVTVFAVLLAFMAFVASFAISQAEAFGERRMRRLIVPAYLMYTAACGSVLYVVMADLTRASSPIYNLFAMCTLSSVALLKLAIWIESDKQRPWSGDIGLKYRSSVVMSLVIGMISMLAAISADGQMSFMLTFAGCASTGVGLAVDRWLTQRGAAMGLARSTGAVAEDGLPPEAKKAAPASS